MSMFHRRSKQVARADGLVVNESEDGRQDISQYPTRGDYGLKRCHDAKDAIVDIVFLHGLTGNRETTWTHKVSGLFWPADLLKKDVPKARIMTFGYDADVVHFWSMASQNRVGNHASNLVNALVQLRERTETQTRPLIFVVHSLGGLVFEDAFLASKNSAEEHIQGLLDQIVGVCFLGTPHCGSNLANWASICGKMVNMVKVTNSSLLNLLKPESEVLARIQQEFHSTLRARSIRREPLMMITCFFEELPVRGVGEVVPKHSAILQGYNSIGIRANHMDMTKFDGKDDPGYLAVSGEIMRWARAVQYSLDDKARSCSSAGFQSSTPLDSMALGEDQRLRGGYLGDQRQEGYPTQSRDHPPNSYYQRQPSSIPASYWELGIKQQQPAMPATRVQQGANAVNIQNQNIASGGKTVQGMNISSEKDVTFNL